MDQQIVNLTQHPATPEQREAGVVDALPQFREHLTGLLTFDTAPTAFEILERAKTLATFAVEPAHWRDWREQSLRSGEPIRAAMIGGAPFLMGALEVALRAQGVTPFYAFSRRESVEKATADGRVEKTAIFRHTGFVRTPSPVETEAWTAAQVKRQAEAYAPHRKYEGIPKVGPIW